MALDVVQDMNPKPKDEEGKFFNFQLEFFKFILEYIQIIRDVPISRIRELIVTGDMMLHSVQTCLMALHYLENNNLL